MRKAGHHGSDASFPICRRTVAWRISLPFPSSTIPYEPCKVQWSSLYDEPTLVSHMVDVWRGDSIPQNFPTLIAQLNTAWNTGKSFVDIFGALWLADFVGSYLAVGGDALYYFHYLPAGLYHGCNGSMGTFADFLMSIRIINRNSQSRSSFASQLINQEWVQPGNGTHQMFPSTSDIVDPAGHTLGNRLRSSTSGSTMGCNAHQQGPGKRT